MICLQEEPKTGVLRCFGMWTHCPCLPLPQTPNKRGILWGDSGDMGYSCYQLLQINSEINIFHKPEYRHWHIKNKCYDFPGGLVDKNLPISAGDTGSIPGPGRSHMQKYTTTTDSCASSTEARHLEPVPCNERPLRWEAEHHREQLPAHRN